MLPACKRVLLLIPSLAQCLTQGVGSLDNHFLVRSTRLAGKAFDRSGHGDRRNDAAGRPTDGSRDRSHAGLTFTEALGPTAAPDSGKNGGGKSGSVQPIQQTFVVLPREQDLGGRTGFHGKLGSYGNGVPQANGTFG